MNSAATEQQLNKLDFDGPITLHFEFKKYWEIALNRIL